MDVSRIDAISPRQIDWRRLTSQEILKYNEQGVEVPSEYLQWAQSFNADIEASDNDDTTYEMANSVTYVDTDSVNSTDETGDNSSENDEDEEKLTASQMHEKMKNEGASLYTIGKTFKAESDTRAEASEDSITSVETAVSSSDSEIESLQSYINDLLAQADEIKSKIESLKSKKNEFEDNTAKIQRYQRELKNLGVSGQTTAAGYDADVTQYQAVIDAAADIGPDAKDYGAETQDIGKELKKVLYFHGFGRKVERSGKNAVQKGEQAQDTQIDASQRNTDNLSTISKDKSGIEAKTGVSASEIDNKNEGSGNNSSSNKSEGSKNIQTAQNDGTDTTAQASTNIDEILKAKIRKGEDINA